MIDKKKIKDIENVLMMKSVVDENTWCAFAQKENMETVFSKKTTSKLEAINEAIEILTLMKGEIGE